MPIKILARPIKQALTIKKIPQYLLMKNIANAKAKKPATWPEGNDQLLHGKDRG